jgi:UDP-N-acetylglucosamine--N-acetylmuramyl-(pentapeptide) pyrophosphoryl-undecaprenol N-acetylglucosamine transferase
VVHQSGRQHLDSLRANYAAAGMEAEVRDYIEDMAAAYQACDFAICRAGAMTVAELACAGVPAVLVPFPYAVDDHQTGNAEFLSSAGAAWLLQQKDLSAEKLASLIGGLDRARSPSSDKARALAKRCDDRSPMFEALVKHAVKRIHFIGIGGVGAGIASAAEPRLCGIRFGLPTTR